MKTIVTAVCLGVLATSVPAVAQESAEEPEKKPAPPERKSMQQLMELSKAGPEHERLAGYAGDWNVTVQTRREELEGTATMRMAVKGAFLVCEYKAGEGRFENSGMFIVGFDRRHGEWSLQAMDNSGTYAVFSRGKKEDGENRYKLYGTDDDPHMQAMGYEKAFAHVIDFKDPDTFSIEIHFIDTRTENRREFKAMTYTFSRKK